MKRKRKVITQRRGAVLMTVTVVTCMMVIIVAAGISLVGHTNSRSNKEYRMKQAYFVAQSCLESFVSQTTGLSTSGTNTEAEIAAAITAMKNRANTGETVTVQINESSPSGVAGKSVEENHPRWKDITCTLKLEKNGGSDTDLRAVSTATYLGESKTVVAYLSVTPLHAGKSNTRALEVIGTNGGGNDSYNNIRVYGNAGAIDTQSHFNNTMYDCQTNDCQFYGDVLIRGSMTSGVQMRLGRNPYFVSGVTDVDSGGNETPGCSITVTRTLNIANNESKFTSPLVKTSADNNTPLGNNAFNYVQTGEALVMQSGGGAYIGDNDNHQVDVYTGLLYMGHVADRPEVVAAIMNSLDNPDPGIGAVAAGRVTPAQRDRYYNKLINGAQGQRQYIYGNVYTFDRGGAINGDVCIDGGNNHIFGDLYVWGKLYGNGQLEVTGTVYFMGDSSNNQLAGLTASNIQYNFNYRSIDRAMEPTIPYEDPDPYRYFPEHMLCLDGFSTIKQTYANLYMADGKTVDPSAPTVNSNHVADGTYTLPNGDVYVGESSSEKIYYINQSAVVDCFGSDSEDRTYIIDLDNAYDGTATGKNADGNWDIVLLLKNSKISGYGGWEQSVKNNKTKVIVHNKDHIDSDRNPERICYFVTDSGVGTCSNETALNPADVSTYDHDSFKRPETDVLTKAQGEFEQYLRDKCGLTGALLTDTATNSALGHHMVDGPVFMSVNGKLKIFEWDTYNAYRDNKTINPTENPACPADYQTERGYNVILGTEGCYIDIGQESIIQASVYCPRGTFHWVNNATNLKIMPDPIYNDPNHSMSLPVNIMGCCITGNFQASNNNNHVVYQKVSEKSMLQKVKGPGRELATESFKLVRYAWS